MDGERFDSLSKRLGSGGSRRGVLRGAIALVAVRFGLGARDARAQWCADYGCTCDAGDYLSCDGDLVCCPYSFDAADGPGTCVSNDECYGTQCSDSGIACASDCGWGASCGECCTGYCNSWGLCDTPSCSGAGCACDTGDYLPCDDGLDCCAYDLDIPGGPGVCSPIGTC